MKIIQYEWLGWISWLFGISDQMNATKIWVSEIVELQKSLKMISNSSWELNIEKPSF